MLRKFAPFLFCITLLGALSTSTWLWNTIGPANQTPTSHYPTSEFPIPSRVDTSACGLTIRHYQQLGNEIGLLPYAAVGGLAPFAIQVTQNEQPLEAHILHQKPGNWLAVQIPYLQEGFVTLRLTSTTDISCFVEFQLQVHAPIHTHLAPDTTWKRYGSVDDLLDVRVLRYGNEYYLKDFARITDKRTKVYLLDGIQIPDLTDSLLVKAGYLYTITTRRIDGPYTGWWNSLRNRTTRQQAVWIPPIPSTATNKTSFKPLTLPPHFSPDAILRGESMSALPQFTPMQQKTAAQYRLFENFTPHQYFSSGVTHLPRWEEDIPDHKKHWTEAPGFFADKDQDWFEGLDKQEVEQYADRVSEMGLYAFDFEFWKRDYSPALAQRLTWFAQRLRHNYPKMQLMDYWGGGAYRNTDFQTSSGQLPLAFQKDYTQPRSNHYNFTYKETGKELLNALTASPIDVYPRPMHPADKDGNTPNNYLVLSAIHATRINRLLSSHQLIWYAWNRHMALYKDPATPTYKQIGAGPQALDFWGLELMPASQAMSLGLFSMLLGDGYYLWHDQQPWNHSATSYDLSEDTRHTLYFQDTTQPLQRMREEHPRYNDYPTPYFMIGHWLAKQVESIVIGAQNKDLAIFVENQWIQPKSDYALQIAHRKLPFVTSFIKGDQIVIAAVDSFQHPASTKSIAVRLPNGKEVIIELYGNWPSVYQGQLP